MLNGFFDLVTTVYVHDLFALDNVRKQTLGYYPDSLRVDIFRLV